MIMIVMCHRICDGALIVGVRSVSCMWCGYNGGRNCIHFDIDLRCAARCDVSEPSSTAIIIIDERGARNVITDSPCAHAPTTRGRCASP